MYSYSQVFIQHKQAGQLKDSSFWKSEGFWIVGFRRRGMSHDDMNPGAFVGISYQ